MSVRGVQASDSDAYTPRPPCWPTEWRESIAPGSCAPRPVHWDLSTTVHVTPNLQKLQSSSDLNDPSIFRRFCMHMACEPPRTFRQRQPLTFQYPPYAGLFPLLRRPTKAVNASRIRARACAQLALPLTIRTLALV